MLVSQNTVSVEDLRFPSGPRELVGTLYKPMAEPVAAVVINGATGVPHKYYDKFARWLATDRKMACLTYDYSDFGASLKGSLKTSKVTMADWGLTDMPAARSEMRRHYPDTPLWIIGHSVGGMLMPLQDGVEDIDRMICVCSGLVHHRDHPWPYQMLARLFWFGHAPALVKLLGYLPGKLIGFGSDLPSGVYWEWRRWCTNLESYLPEVGSDLPDLDWTRSDAPVQMIALRDDQVIPPKCVWRLSELYGSNVDRLELVPANYGLKKVGHLGAFAGRNSAIWPEIVA